MHFVSSKMFATYLFSPVSYHIQVWHHNWVANGMQKKNWLIYAVHMFNGNHSFFVFVVVVVVIHSFVYSPFLRYVFSSSISSSSHAPEAQKYCELNGLVSLEGFFDLFRKQIELRTANRTVLLSFITFNFIM